MIGQLDHDEAQTPELWRNSIGGMFADEHGAAASVGIDQLDGGRLV
jgi:hypothetical protein